jgi:hypothetical protein
MLHESLPWPGLASFRWEQKLCCGIHDATASSLRGHRGMQSNLGKCTSEENKQRIFVTNNLSEAYSQAFPACTYTR